MSDVSDRRGLPGGERRTAIYVRVVLGAEVGAQGGTRYLLETILSTLGLPYEFADGSSRDDPRAGDRHVSLVAGKRDALTPTLSQGERELPPLPLGEGRGEGVPALSTASSLLSREEEYEIPARDAHDRFLAAHRPPDVSEGSARPVVSEYALQLLASVRETAGRSGLPMIQKEFWPRGRPMAACLTHDVDVVRRGKLPRGVAVRDVAGALAAAVRGRLGLAVERAATIVRTAAADQDPYWTFDRIAALETAHGYRSTYFVMAGRHHQEDAGYGLGDPLVVGLLRDLAASGREVALHGSYASHRDPELLRVQKVRLEAHLGQPVAGHRNHFLRFRVPDSWRAQEATGFSYDATLGFADREGFRGGHAFPFHPYDLAAGRALDLLEIPLAAMDVTLSKYRRLRGEGAWEAVEAVLEQTRAVHGLATLLWHNDTFYDPDYPGSGGLYERALAWLSANGAHVAPCGDIDRWWRAREAVRVLPLETGETGWRVETPLEIEGLVLRVSSHDPQRCLQVKGHLPAGVRRDGPDHLVEFGRLPAGSDLRVEF